ncbi:MAG TPA: di-heme oxidoredictase family protein, partial [Burkholderiales bacterium]|nr:di-heme oxidoredictase family protein [Burkholderiales bacterium]
KFFEHGKEDFEEVEKVADGLGPRMNLDGCGSCHSQPAIGGSSPAVNPQVAFANAANPSQLAAVAAFITLDGPIRETRLVRHPDGTPDGGVTNTFTITGREGADGCNIRQHDFAWEIANRNIIFRIPTPVFGAGLIEQIPDSVILANMEVDFGEKSALGIRGKPNVAVTGRTISGAPNRNGNDGTIARFGWKAQNQSLLLFSGEAYNVEMGITSELFQSEREQAAGCQYAEVPNDTQNFNAGDALTGTTAIQNFANFQRFLAPPTPSSDTPGGATSIARGRSVFSSVGCALCHTPTLRTGDSTVFALRNRDANLYSDLLLHNMGEGLADGVSQGAAGPREFRTSPLWGLGQRIFFLHDGRTSDLKVAISEHASDGSEARGVIRRYNALRENQKQDLLNFLRSL